MSWSRCTWDDFNNKAVNSYLNSADQVSLFAEEEDFAKGIKKFLIYAMALNDDGKHRLFSIVDPDGSTYNKMFIMKMMSVLL